MPIINDTRTRLLCALIDIQLRDMPSRVPRGSVPFKIVSTVAATTTRLKLEEKSLRGAMKKLNFQVGYLIAPVDTAVPPPKKGGVEILPWDIWS
jgi:hypothetical protein